MLAWSHQMQTQSMRTEQRCQIMYGEREIEVFIACHWCCLGCQIQMLLCLPHACSMDHLLLLLFCCSLLGLLALLELTVLERQQVTCLLEGSEMLLLWIGSSLFAHRVAIFIFDILIPCIRQLVPSHRDCGGLPTAAAAPVSDPKAGLSSL